MLNERYTHQLVYNHYDQHIYALGVSQYCEYALLGKKVRVQSDGDSEELRAVLPGEEVLGNDRRNEQDEVHLLLSDLPPDHLRLRRLYGQQKEKQMRKNFLFLLMDLRSSTIRRTSRNG